MHLTTLNRTHLHALALGLWNKTFIGEFNMLNFLNPRDSDAYLEYDKIKPTCNTVGCALGWAPHIVTPWIETDNTSYNRYCNRVFGFNAYHTPTGEERELWCWLFSHLWERTDNTAKGAAQRILWFLRYGLPCTAVDQMQGYIPICYTGEEP